MVNYSVDQEKQYHIQVAPGEIGRYVILPGDPKRYELIAQYFDNPQLIADSREYVTYTGTLDEVKVSVTSTGIGGPSAAIFIVANYLKVRAGSVLLVMANQERAKAGLENPVIHDTDAAIHTAVEAIRMMIREDAGY